jgi:hypothetical protein
VFKRVVWFGLGAAAGASGVVWAEQQVRRRIEELGPDHVVTLAGRSARRVGRSLLDAVAEGREVAADTEDELRARRDQRLRDGRRPGEVRPGVVRGPTRS